MNDIAKMVGDDPKYQFGSGDESNPGTPPAAENPPGENPPPTTGQTTGGEMPPNEGQTPPTTGGETPPATSKTETPSKEEIAKQVLSQINERLGTQYGDFETFQKDYSSIGTLRESERKLKDYVQKVSNPFGDDEELAGIYGFRQATQRSIDDYFTVKNLNLDDCKSMDILVAESILNNPGLRGQESVIRDVLSRKYKLDDEDLDEKTRKMNELEMDLDTSKARQLITELKNHIKAPDFENPIQEADPSIWEGHQKTWQGIIPNLANEISQFNIYENSEAQAGGKDPLTTFDIPQEVLNEYNAKIKQYVDQTRMEPTDQNKQALLGLITQDYILNNYLLIANKYAAKKLEENNSKWKERTGLDLDKMGQTNVPKDKPGSVAEFNRNETDRILKQIGVK